MKKGDGEFISQIEKPLLCCTNHSRTKYLQYSLADHNGGANKQNNTQQKEQLSSLWHFRWAHLSAFARGASYSRPNKHAGKMVSKQKTAAIVGILRSAAYFTGERMFSVISSSINVGLLIISFVSCLHLYNSCVNILKGALMKPSETKWDSNLSDCPSLSCDLLCCSSENSMRVHPVSRFPPAP